MDYDKAYTNIVGILDKFTPKVQRELINACKKTIGIRNIQKCINSEPKEI